MDVRELDYALPEELVALRPARPRDAARLLIVDGTARRDAHVYDLPNYLKPGDVLVLNDTRVISARLFGIRPKRKDGVDVKVELMLNRRLDARRWEAFARPAKRLREGDRIRFASGLEAEVLVRADAGLLSVEFNCEGTALDAAIAQAGTVPLPPYIANRREADTHDQIDYQTIYASAPGAVAAPTAGLHLTAELLANLRAREVGQVSVTLHVGAGTFLPMVAETTEQHVMHAEWGRVSTETAAAINAARERGGRIIAVGTTALRLLESAADPDGRVVPFAGETRLFITPGYRFRTVTLLLTNFHLPRSTLLALVYAFGGMVAIRAAYAHAIAQRYRFYSYGDAMLIGRSHE